MEVRMESKNGEALTGVDAVLTEIRQRLQVEPQKWRIALQENSGAFGNLEQEIHGAFSRMADRVVAGLLAVDLQRSLIWINNAHIFTITIAHSGEKGKKRELRCDESIALQLPWGAISPVRPNFEKNGSNLAPMMLTLGLHSLGCVPQQHRGRLAPPGLAIADSVSTEGEMRNQRGREEAPKGTTSCDLRI